jgi:hypothetical protein
MSIRRVYFDACCFIELVLDANGDKLADGGRYVWPLRTLLRASRDERIQVVTSAFSIVECLSANSKADEKIQHLFRGFLTSGTSGVLPWQLDPFVLERARDLNWKHGIKLNPSDSVHVATALEAGCEEFITWDGSGGKRKSILKAGQDLSRMSLTVCLPSDTKCIPEDYRQQQLVLPEKSAGEKATTPQTGR